MSDADVPEPQEPRKAACRPCESIWGVFGIGVGLVILCIGLDLATHGALTRAITRSPDDDSN